MRLMRIDISLCLIKKLLDESFVSEGVCGHLNKLSNSTRLLDADGHSPFSASLPSAFTCKHHQFSIVAESGHLHGVHCIS